MNQGPRPEKETHVGSGWLREAPQNVRANMRRRIFMPSWNVLAPLLPVSHRAASLAPSPRPEPTTEKPPLGHVRPPAPERVLPAPVVEASPWARPPRATPNVQAAAQREDARAWWEEPPAVGALLVLAPPVGLAALWASPRYTREARWAITGMMALWLAAAVVVLR